MFNINPNTLEQKKMVKTAEKEEDEDEDEEEECIKTNLSISQ